MTWTGFAPYEALADRLLARVERWRHADRPPEAPEDGAHDMAHVQRVWTNATAIAAVEGGDLELIAAGVLLHECVAIEKSSPLRSQASRLAADRAAQILTEEGWPANKIETVRHAVAAHSFSASIPPETLEARIVQDADRLDAIGMIGVARCFYTAGRMGSALYDPADPSAEHRALDDRAYALDHFRTKLLHLADGFQTATGTKMAEERTRATARFVQEFEKEIGR